MKKIVIAVLAIMSWAAAGGVSAQGMMGGYQQNATSVIQNQELNGVLEQIYQSQNISGVDELDCGKVTNDQFDRLGDAYMGATIPSEQQHEYMDNMMGGEGSDSLRQAHINMGRSYLGCWSNYSSGPVYMPMMGGYGMYGGMGWGNNMMYGFGYGSSWMIAIYVLVIIFLLFGIAAFAKYLLGRK